MVRLVELAPDAAPAQGEAALLLQRFRRADGYDYYVQATAALEARLPQPFPHGGFGFRSFAGARLFAEGLATAAGLPQLYLGFPVPPPGGSTQAPAVAVCDAEAAEAAAHEAPGSGTSWFEALLARSRGRRPAAAAIVHPCEAATIAAVAAAARLRLIAPILIGPETEIRRAAAEAHADLAGVPIVAGTPRPPPPAPRLWRAMARRRS